MTLDQIYSLDADFEVLFEKHRSALDTVPGWDTTREAIMLGLAAIIETERRSQTHPGVIAALDSCVDGLRQAALDYYVSTK